MECLIKKKQKNRTACNRAVKARVKRGDCRYLRVAANAPRHRWGAATQTQTSDILQHPPVLRDASDKSGQICNKSACSDLPWSHVS